ncbi:MAG: heterodisulfide reductase-related iron-sulfur binding cluster, partial [Ginsengibacter sp.]
GKLRPRTAYAFGWIYWWSRLASAMPGVVNFLTHAPVLAPIAKAIAGVTQKRSIPKFAERTFRDWFKSRNKKNTDKPRVIIWADTFNNFFLPETLVAGVNVLEAAGFQVVIPKKILCCGRPLYDFGMLNQAKKMLVEIMHTLKDDIQNGTPIVGFEPSCVAVFRDELHNLFPHSEEASRLKKQVFTLAEFLEKKAPDFKIPSLKNKAIIQGHCHHKAIMKMDSEKSLLKKANLDYEMLDSGCCGMAGYFGYEKGDHYDVSIKAGERVLLPAVRKASDTTIIIADGFSCREQIEQETNRKGMHLAQVIQMALQNDNSNSDSPETFPERKYVDEIKLQRSGKPKKAIALAGFVAVAALAIYLISKRNKY